ncbi:er big1 [Fusarium longipes]|uniref:Protein BIG1 n=1 Tax=Fusarium longipes TaxID=694270 RepID=A0A395RKT7_9HYPO|nr:er big1 [Fusarium longipes]
MRLQILASAFALSGSAAAFSDSWPLVMFSTAKYDARPVFYTSSSLLNDDDDRFSDATSNNQIQTRSQALEQVKDILTSCPTDNYVLIAQEGANAADIRRMNAKSNLHQAIARKEIQGKFIVPEVVGESIDADAIQDYIQTACYEQAKKVEPHFTLLKTEDDKEATKQWTSNGMWMKDSYTVLFVGTPSTRAKTASTSKKVSEKTIYESEFVEPLRMDLKRDVSEGSKAGNATRDTRGLFEKYQFFTPGIFMAIITALVLFSILGVGLRALASLEVSYGAFEKDMGPAAQKKQQ